MSNLRKLRSFALPLVVLLGLMTLFAHTTLAAGKRDHVAVALPVGSYFTYMSADFKVPDEAPDHGSGFIWPGLQPNGNSTPTGVIGTGVLQPVLGHGPSCHAGVRAGWYVSATYHIRNDHIPVPASIAGEGVHASCPTGPVMLVNEGDQLETSISYNPTTQEWNMSIKDVDTDQTVTFDRTLSIDSVPQRQNYALLFFEGRNGARLKKPITFTNVVLKATHPTTVTKPIICPKRDAKDQTKGDQDAKDQDAKDQTKGDQDAKDQDAKDQTKGGQFIAPEGCSGASSKLEGHVETCTIKKCVVN